MLDLQLPTNLNLVFQIFSSVLSNFFLFYPQFLGNKKKYIEKTFVSKDFYFTFFFFVLDSFYFKNIQLYFNKNSRNKLFLKLKIISMFFCDPKPKR